MEMKRKVRVWEQKVVFPTYRAGEPDRNPLFLEKRVYQGSSGRVYPHPVTDRISDAAERVSYRALFLENDYIKVMILPELGGRVARAFDKIKNYDFIYYNSVIKPALVGLAGPWISGGIEFNWPQHHRPSTFDEVNWAISEGEDGSATVTVSEIENMFHTKGETEFTLYPDRAYIELKNHIFNRTPVRQTFLWWANPAVAVNENYRSVFPPDVTAVMDHGKRDVSTFPIATGTYYKVDYSRGVDISRYVNLPVPTSYMAAKSDFDFVGGYDEGVGAGLLHVADHHVSPGKKQWTWGCGDFGRAWDRNLTDSDGPYFELMTGCFTDNQPDFSFIEPYETRDFTQYFMPYHDLGTVHNATRDIAIRLDVDDKITLSAYCSGQPGEYDVTVNGRKAGTIELKTGGTSVFTRSSGGKTFSEVRVALVRDGKEAIAFDGGVRGQPIPSPAASAPLPAECETVEDLYLYGMHVEQYRHATRRAEDYYLEGLRREPANMTLNGAYADLLLKKGFFNEAKTHYEAAIAKATRSNPNPPTGRYHYGLGVTLFYLGDEKGAFDAFYKATWNADSACPAWYFLAALSSRAGRCEQAKDFAREALVFNGRNFAANNLLAQLEDRAPSLDGDRLDILGLYLNGENIKRHVVNPNMLIDLSVELAVPGFYEEALKLLKYDDSGFPLTDYYRAYFTEKLGRDPGRFLRRAAAADPYLCFPNRLTDIAVLSFAEAENPSDFKAPYYLGCLYYDRERHADAKREFEESIKRGADFATPYRNLALLRFNVFDNKKGAKRALDMAFSLDKTDARVLLEADLLRRRLLAPPKSRRRLLEQNLETVKKRDDLFLEYITLLNLTGESEKALKLVTGRRFHPWEGGEGKVPEQYIFSNIAVALRSGDTAPLYASFDYPESLGEGKLYGAQENRQNYILGVMLEAEGKSAEAKERFALASDGISEPASAIYYNDQPPESIFYQGMARLALGDKKGAAARFDKLIKFADLHMDDTVTPDYFAVSLPDLLVLDDDLSRRNRIHCIFMKALGLYGKGEKDASRALFDEALAADPGAFAPASSFELLFDLLPAYLEKHGK